MLSRRAKTLLLTMGVLGAVVPVLAQDLPPGFGDPKAQQPKEQPKATPPPTPETPPPPPAGIVVSPGDPGARPVRVQDTEDSAVTDLEALPPQPVPRFYDLPAGEERPTDVVGVINITNRGLPLDAFSGTSGAFLVTLMDRLEGPLPSRWTSMLLRRALMSRVQAPPQVDPVDFVAARVRLLVRMGEADAARMLAQSIDVRTYRPSMVRAAYEASLASSDPAGLCPLVQQGREAFTDPVWPMADAMCAALEGEAARASTLLDQARRSGARGFDLMLAEKIVGAGADTRRSVTLEWDPVQDMNIWRFGLVTAAGDEIPERLVAGSGPAMQAWLARAPMVPVAQRLAAADTAAALGVFSSASLVDAHALAMQLSEDEDMSGTIAGRLQTAYAGADIGTRMTALRSLWQDGANDPLRRYARLILTAGAVAQVAPSEDLAADADEMVSSLMAAGMDREAAAWSGIVENAGDAETAWAVLAVASPRPIGVDAGRVQGFDGGGVRARLLAAALAGLGRTDAGTAQGSGVDLGRENEWTRALDRAASSGQSGVVALLAAVGLQTADWESVPPEHLFRILRALRQVGLDYEARMIAAEAVTRS